MKSGVITELNNVNEAKKTIRLCQTQPALFNNSEFALIFNLFKLLVENAPLEQSLKEVNNIIDLFKNVEEYDRVLFYIDIALDICEKLEKGYEREEIRLLKLKISLLQK